MPTDRCAPELMFDGYLTVSRSGRVLYANEAARRWLDLPDHADHEPPALQDLLPTDCALRHLLGSGAPHAPACQGTCRGVQVHLRPDGLELQGPPRPSPSEPRTLPEALNGAQHIDEVAQVILTHPHWQALAAQLALFDPVGATLRLLQAGPDGPDLLGTLPVQDPHPVAQAFRGGAARTHAPGGWPDPLPPGTRDVLILPLRSPQRPLGALVLHRAEDLPPPTYAALDACAAALARAAQFDDVSRSQLRYRTLLESTHAALWELDRNFEIQGESPNWQALTGQTYAEYVGRGFMAVIHPDDRPRLEADIARGVQGSDPFELRGRMRRIDGQYRHVVAVALPVPEERGAGQGWAGSIQDVTEEVWAAEWERPSERFLTLAVQGGPARPTFAAVLDELTRVTGATGGLLVGLPRGGGAPRTLATSGATGHLHAQLDAHLDDPQVTALSARPGWLHPPGETGAPTGQPARGALLVPLQYQERVIAAALLDVPAGLVDATSLEHLRWLQAHLAPIVHSAQLRDALDRSEAQARSIVSALDEGVVMIDAAGRLIAANRAAQDLLDLPPGQSLPPLHDPVWALQNERGEPVPFEQYPAVTALRTGRPVRQVILSRTRRDGQRRWLSINATPLEDRSGVVASFSDVSESITLREQLTAQAFQDDLTGLSNRRAFQRAAQEQRGPRAAALLIDVDHFKAVNDTHGHHVGDDLLREIAARLRREAPPGSLIARLGGDEFGVSHPDLSTEDACALARRIVQVIGQPVVLGRVHAHVSASVGVATTERLRGADLHRAADLAMYVVKRAGRSGWQLFDPDEHLPT
ncbi:bifunctional diguanylate cyclase/phosphodiesterase [Deinococcus xianganensis]|uniref:Diguanylate cyclase n=1 Tax=Deinococcus xianganensis TaxID=1507289 RepID=A0A6I4YE70_9DEIO|nr:diguanylate cyclase [Deinococcus xianganensis]MXV18710.1 diguanylate cyclase [Deinococcus xianganensis]